LAVVKCEVRVGLLFSLLKLMPLPDIRAGHTGSASISA
jgi:hypothetical protein